MKLNNKLWAKDQRFKSISNTFNWYLYFTKKVLRENLILIFFHKYSKNVPIFFQFCSFYRKISPYTSVSIHTIFQISSYTPNGIIKNLVIHFCSDNLEVPYHIMLLRINFLFRVVFKNWDLRNILIALAAFALRCYTYWKSVENICSYIKKIFLLIQSSRLELSLIRLY